MNDIQRSILAVSSALAIFLVALILRSADNQAESVRVAKAKLHFEAESACETAKTLATDFPERGMGTPEAAAAAAWIESQMATMGLETERQEFDAWLAGERVTGRNVIGIDEGVRSETVVVIAHYDIPFHVRGGAMDDASGVGVLLELARIFSREKQKKTLVFIASDGEEWGMLGARHYAGTLPDPGSIRAAISLDCVVLEEPAKITVRGQGQFRGQVPLWLWMLAEDCISKVGGEPMSHETLDQFLSQAVNISATDQGPFLRAGVPGVNLGGAFSESPLSRKVYHTTLDTAENLKPELFDVYGRSAELMVRSLDALDYSTDSNPHYLRTGGRKYVGRSGLLAMQIIVFIPLLMATCFQYYNLRERENFMRATMIEAANLFLFLLPWALALIALHAVVWHNMIPRYELYPATPLDPFLKQPNWGGIGLVALAAAVGWVGVWLARRALSFNVRPDFENSKAVCLDMLLTISVITLIVNGFAACLFLAPAALLWSWIDGGRKPGRIFVNVALVVAAAMPLVLLAATFSGSLRLGPYVLWYFLLGAGYGFFSPLTVMILAAAATVGVRLLQQSVLATEPAAESDDPERSEVDDA